MGIKSPHNFFFKKTIFSAHAHRFVCVCGGGERRMVLKDDSLALLTAYTPLELAQLNGPLMGNAHFARPPAEVSGSKGKCLGLAGGLQRWRTCGRGQGARGRWSSGCSCLTQVSKWEVLAAGGAEGGDISGQGGGGTRGGKEEVGVAGSGSNGALLSSLL